MFGAPTVLRNSPSLLSGYKTPSPPTQAPSLSSPQSPLAPQPRATPAPSRHAVTSYSLSKIRSRLGFEHDALVLIALGAGADYAPSGLPGLGVQHAVTLVSFGFPTQLLHGLHALRHRSTQEKTAFLAEWREAVATTLERDEEGLQGRRYVSLAGKVREATGFPDLAVVEAYLRPVVTPPEQRKEPNWDREPDLKRIVRWCVDQLKWSEEDVSGLFCSLNPAGRLTSRTTDVHPSAQPALERPRHAPPAPLRPRD